MQLAPGRGVFLLQPNPHCEYFWPLPKDAELGQRELRLERCKLTHEDHTHEFTLIERRPNVWRTRCLTCRL